MKPYVLSAAACEDVKSIWEYIVEQAGTDTADRVLKDLRHAMRRLAETPGIGHLREDLAREPLRFWSVHSHLIIYRPDSKPLGIARVLHAARDIKALLPDE